MRIAREATDTAGREMCLARKRPAYPVARCASAETPPLAIESCASAEARPERDVQKIGISRTRDAHRSNSSTANLRITSTDAYLPIRT
jgi:hypothetical protein